MEAVSPAYSCPPDTVVTPGNQYWLHQGQHGTAGHHVSKIRSKERLLRSRVRFSEKPIYSDNGR